MFGYGSLMPKKSHQLVIGIILVALFFSLGTLFSGEDSTKITGRVVEDTFQDDLANNPSLSNKDSQDQIEDTNEEIIEEEYEVYEYYEYGGECSFKIKQAEDDVNDILSYLGENDDTYNILKNEYEEKLESLKNEYEPKIEEAKLASDSDQGNLYEAQEKLQELQEVCSF
jgi:hypothetical protein